MVTLCTCVKSYIYTTPLYIFPSRTIKYATNTCKKYFTLLPQRITYYLTAYFDEKNPSQRVVHFKVFYVPKKSPRLNTPFPNARSEKRKIPAQNDQAATNPTQSPSTYASALNFWPPGYFALGFFATRIGRSEMECSALGFSYVRRRP